MRRQKTRPYTSLFHKPLPHIAIGCAIGMVVILCLAGLWITPRLVALALDRKVGSVSTKVFTPSRLFAEAQPSTIDIFTEDFNTPLSDDWSRFTITASTVANPERVSIQAEDGKLVWEFDSVWVYYYLLYDAYMYKDVQLDLRVENKGKNNNSVSLICRYNPDQGWYEFNIANNGLYSVLFMEVLGKDRFRENRLADGSSNAIKQGQSINEYSVTCQDDKFTLRINGSDVITVEDKQFRVGSGRVGISVSSFNVLPIIVEMDWFKVSAP